MENIVYPVLKCTGFLQFEYRVYKTYYRERVAISLTNCVGMKLSKLHWNVNKMLSLNMFGLVIMFYTNRIRTFFNLQIWYAC